MFNHRRGGVTESLRLFNQCRILISEGTEIQNAGGKKSTKTVSDLYLTFAFYGKRHVDAWKVASRMLPSTVVSLGFAQPRGRHLRANSPPSLHSN